MPAVSVLAVFASSAVAHSSENGTGYGPGMMDGGGWMHGTGHMAGYNVWAPGWYGLMFGLVFWALALLGLIYLFRIMSERKGE